METDDLNCHHFEEILLQDNDVFLLGSGATDQKIQLSSKPTDQELLNYLKAVIDDPASVGVGGAIQYGRLSDQRLRTFGIVDYKDNIHLWRGALDMNDPEMKAAGEELSCLYPYIDPFDAFAEMADNGCQQKQSHVSSESPTPLTS